MPPRNGLRDNGRGRPTTGRRNRANQGHGLPRCLRNSYCNILESPSPSKCLFVGSSPGPFTLSVGSDVLAISKIAIMAMGANNYRRTGAMKGMVRQGKEPLQN